MPIRARFHLEQRLRQQRRRVTVQNLAPFPLPKALGNGAYSTAFALGRTKVLKITDARDRTAYWFRRYVGRFPNGHWPRIYRQVRLGKTYIVTWMERLYPLDRVSKEQVSCVDDFVMNAGHNCAARLEELAQFGFGGPWEGCPKSLRQPLLDCRRAAGLVGFVPDAKRDVFMRRKGGQLVLIDPFLVPGRRARRL